ncbi:MAG: YraN family protein [Pseudomonadota bacterium]
MASAGGNPNPKANRRKAAERRGRRGETLAALMLRLKGYRIVAQRLQTRLGEIDLIARRGTVLVFVEVKARPTITGAIHAVSPKARRRIEQAAHQWASRIDPKNQLGRRYDIVAVRPWRWPVHIRDAWRPDFAQSPR